MPHRVIHLSRQGDIGVVTLEERRDKNTFSLRFVEQLRETFESIRLDGDLKVVVVRGYDNYFCCGGTKEELISILEGKTRFTDLNFFDLLLECPVPVIAAMQGHALGGGLAFGCFADMIVMARQRLYGANFMKYGFTPGMGATYIIPARLGEMLGHEMLYTAKVYYGKELKERGAPVNIVSADQVVPEAMKIARELAQKPRLSLKVLKEELTRKTRKVLPGVIERELKMHEITFAQPGVRERIETLFGQ